MIDLYYWPTPNGHKITLFLEETGLPYTIKPVDIGRGDQFKPEYLAISPNNKMPAIVDHGPVDGGAPLSVFESGAILVYLAGKTGRCIPKDARGKVECLEWLFWQVGGLGPMTGQHGHFSNYAPEKIPYAMDRYRKESERLLDVLDRRLKGRRFITGDDYTIADMACWPWIDPYSKAPLNLEPFAEVRRWRAAIAARPATIRALARGEEVSPSSGKTMGDEEKKILFGQGARSP
ncbi:MAG: glutathione S-transferase N-terminal domain-containing protein [Proteobacteria bacterium]|nr:glutathione S-transferase N-terminal domain-containing protein [Pseudomonadota bacterium]